MASEVTFFLPGNGGSLRSWLDHIAAATLGNVGGEVGRASTSR